MQAKNRHLDLAKKIASHVLLPLLGVFGGVVLFLGLVVLGMVSSHSSLAGTDDWLWVVFIVVLGAITFILPFVFFVRILKRGSNIELND